MRRVDPYVRQIITIIPRNHFTTFTRIFRTYCFCKYTDNYMIREFLTNVYIGNF